MGLQTDNLLLNQNVPIFVNHTDGPDDAIRFLKTDLNSLICLLEIDHATWLKLCS